MEILTAYAQSQPDKPGVIGDNGNGDIVRWTYPTLRRGEPVRERAAAWYLLEGTLAVPGGEQVHPVSADGAVIVPGVAAHTFWNPLRC